MKPTKGSIIGVVIGLIYIVASSIFFIIVSIGNSPIHMKLFPLALFLMIVLYIMGLVLILNLEYCISFDNAIDGKKLKLLTFNNLIVLVDVDLNYARTYRKVKGLEHINKIQVVNFYNFYNKKFKRQYVNVHKYISNDKIKGET